MGVTIESNDEAPLNLQTSTLDSFNVFHQVTVLILVLAAFRQTALLRRLDSYKDGIESCFNHHLHERFVISQVYGSFRVEGHPFLTLPPFDKGWKECSLEISLVPDEIVINEEDRPVPTQAIKIVQFPDHLFSGLHPWPVAEQDRDIAELTIERASP